MINLEIIILQLAELFSVFLVMLFNIYFFFLYMNIYFSFIFLVVSLLHSLVHQDSYSSSSSSLIEFWEDVSSSWLGGGLCVCDSSCVL